MKQAKGQRPLFIPRATSRPTASHIRRIWRFLPSEMVICSTTGFSILASGVPLEGASAASLAAEAFGTVSPLFKYVVSVSLILFASTSIMSQWYFGHVSLMYIKSLKGDRFYRILFPVLILLGSLSTAGIVWSVQDCMLGLLIIPNVLALLKLSPVVMKLTAEFFRENHK